MTTMTIREAVHNLTDPTHRLIEATFPMSDSDLCEDERVVEFIHAVSEFAAGTLALLSAMVEATEEAQS